MVVVVVLVDVVGRDNVGVMVHARMASRDIERCMFFVLVLVRMFEILFFRISGLFCDSCKDGGGAVFTLENPPAQERMVNSIGSPLRCCGSWPHSVPIQ